jgi:hypothetical protein
MQLPTFYTIFTYQTPHLDAAFSETSPDDSSSGTSFKSGSKMSCDVENVVGLAEITEESAGLEINCLATPVTTPVLVSGDQEKEMARSMAELREDWKTP